MFKHIRVSLCLFLILLMFLVMQVGSALKSNKLASDAAVTVIPASEQGHGFSVVTAEVGHMTQRSAQAVKEMMLKLTQRNVALVQEGAAVSPTLEEQSANLIRSVSTSRLTGHGQARDSSTFTPRQVAQAATHNVTSLLQHKNSQIAGNWETY